MKHTFRKRRVELCGACFGGGFAPAAEGATVMPVCPVCAGSGRVAKTWEGTVTVEPYAPDTDASGDPWQGCWP